MKSTLVRRIGIFALAVLGLLVLALLLLATFPLSWLHDRVERQLGERFGTAVRIGAIERESRFTLTPVIRVRNVHIAQAEWAGKGEMVSIRLLRFRVPLLPMLAGRVSADPLTASGVRADLVRAADGRENWRKDRGDDGDGDGLDLTRFTIDDAVVRYRDDFQKRSLTLAVRIAPQAGLTAEGSGFVDGAPVRVHVRGGPATAGGPWPFDAVIDGPALGVHAAGTMAAPLRIDDMRFRMTARADDLKRLDRVIEAGLFGTQPVDLSADVEHEGTGWTIAKLTGSIGHSRLAGRLTVDKVDGRSKLDGDVRFRTLDFADLASDRGLAKGAALRKAQGPRLVPNTRINIRKIDKTDGRIVVRADRLIGRGPSAITDISGTLNLDDRILTVEPLRLGLRHGAIVGKAVVDQRAGQPKPRVTIALDMRDSRISSVAGGKDAEVDGRLDGRVRLTGVGDTIREAVGNSNGSIGLAARAGVLPTKIAALMGFDIGKGLIGDDEGRSSLRCAIMHLTVRKGRGTVDPLLIDTDISQTRGSGTVIFPEERIAISLTGVPKGKAALRFPGPVLASGTIREPRIVVPEGSKSVGTLVKVIGRAIAGKNAPSATDANCGALLRKLL